MAKKKEASEDEEVKVEEEKKPSAKKKKLDEYVISSHALLSRKTIIIPVSPALDIALGGGIPEGSFIIPTGPPKIGKTSMCLQFAANAQRQEYVCDIGDSKGRNVYFFNIEGRLKPRDLEGIHGLNKDRFHVIQSKPGEILDAEDYIELGEKLINEKPGDIFIFDSFSQLCTRGERTSEIGDRYRADAPVLLAKFCRRICNVLPINRCFVFGITHLIANQDASSRSKWSEASGQKIQYEVDVKLKATYKEPVKVGEVQVGQDIHWKCECSAIGPPNTECVSRLRYGYGLDFEGELIELAADFGLIKKAGGGWYTFSDESKVQGVENARNKLIAEPSLFQSLNEQLRKMVFNEGN